MNTFQFQTVAPLTFPLTGAAKAAADAAFDRYAEIVASLSSFTSPDGDPGCNTATEGLAMLRELERRDAALAAAMASAAKLPPRYAAFAASLRYNTAHGPFWSSMTEPHAERVWWRPAERFVAAVNNAGVPIIVGTLEEQLTALVAIGA